MGYAHCAVDTYLKKVSVNGYCNFTRYDLANHAEEAFMDLKGKRSDVTTVCIPI